MDPTFSDEDLLLRDTMRDYALTRLLPDYLRWKNEPFPKERLRELGELGVLGIRVPTEYGGSDGSLVSLGIAAEELSRGDFNVSYFLQLDAIAAELMTAGADKDLAAHWLPRLAMGDCLLAFGLTEPGVGSDAARLATTARRDGSDFVITGEKASITFAGTAEGCFVFARTGGPGSQGISIVFVPLDAKGVERRVYSSVGGHLCERGSLFFDEVRVPATYQVGEEGTGFVEAMKAFDFNRAVIAMACVGAAQQSVDETIEYAKVRETFGRPLARHEGVAFQIAEHLSLLSAARLVALNALALSDAGKPHTAEAAMAKWLGPKLSVEAIHACMLLHGWAGYGTDMPLAQRLQDVIGLEVGDGTPEIMKGVIAREAFGRAFTSYK